MIDRRSIAFLLFAIFLSAGQTAWIQLIAQGGRDEGPRTGEPFVYLLPPAQPDQQSTSQPLQ